MVLNIKKRNILTYILTFYYWCLVSFSIILTWLIGFGIQYIVDEKSFGKMYENICKYIQYFGMTIPGFWNIQIKDLRYNKSYKKQYVIIANHISYVDSFAMSLLPFPKKYMIASIYSQIPIFGWMCKRSGYIFVDEKNKKSRENAVMNSILKMDDGSSIVIYPEGRREKIPYKLLKFKTGAFRIAQKLKIPILPVILKGTSDAMDLKGHCYPANMEMIILNPVKIPSSSNPLQNWNFILKSILQVRQKLTQYGVNKQLKCCQI